MTNLESYLASLGAEKSEGTGVFTLAADRARELLKEKALHDPWQAWLCIFQGFHRMGAQALKVQVDRNQVSVLISDGWSSTKTLRELTADERFLLGWLNLDWFGDATWEPRSKRFGLKWGGAVWKRYRTASVLRSLLKSTLCYSPVDIQLDNRPLALQAFPSAKNHTLFLSGRAQGLGIESPFENKEQAKTVLLEDGSNQLAALAYRSTKSWSQARWVQDGVLIKEERNTLERPGLFVVACVEALGLHTDLSGFNIIHDDKYLQFANRLKKEVLWML